ASASRIPMRKARSLTLAVQTCGATRTSEKRHHVARSYVLPLIADRCLVDHPFHAIPLESLRERQTRQRTDLDGPPGCDVDGDQIARLEADRLLHVSRERDLAVFAHSPNDHATPLIRHAVRYSI